MTYRSGLDIQFAKLPAVASVSVVLAEPSEWPWDARQEFPS